MNAFARLNLGKNPIMLAPLAGVSDSPFRQVCAAEGADLTYVEMLSATALIHHSKKTYQMLYRHPQEKILGVQLTGKTAAEVGEAVALLNPMDFDTIDLNMGCPVTKVTKNGAGSAILKEPDRVYQTVKAARAATKKPLSAKIRIGWDRQTSYPLEVADAVAQGGADWLVVHGRRRNDDYSVPIDLDCIKVLKQRSPIPVIGNGNLFCGADAQTMGEKTGVDGLMVSRGALGNPWVFRALKGQDPVVTLDRWQQVVAGHLRAQATLYGDRGMGLVCMRKHLLWYVKGWPMARKFRERINQIADFEEAQYLLASITKDIAAAGVQERAPVDLGQAGRFAWDPKFDMHRKHDRGLAYHDFQV